ncbi:hypothetical protein [Micromonospora sp. NBC_00421]|uniref:hypothetical protein n=1 Tax=Micromonospora sp. NBC_00421 TaxID=2975976 RepID=UPI002E240C44
MIDIDGDGQLSRAQQVRDAAAEQLVDGQPAVVATPCGDVEIVEVTYYGDPTDEDGDWIEVRTGANEAGDPHFRIVNPPIYAQDPAGDVEIGGRRYRADPVAALAEAIGSFGGARVERRRQPS